MCGAGEPEGWRSGRWVRSRKERPCYACHETIRRGDLYHRESGAEPGESPFSYAHCARCWHLLEWLSEHVGDSIPYRLDCGTTYKGWEGTGGDLRHRFLAQILADPDPALEMAFMTPDEGQRLAASSREKEQRRIERWTRT